MKTQYFPTELSYTCYLNINSIVICAQVILGYGRVRSVHQMYTSFSWETEGAFEVAFKLRQPLSHRGDAFGLGMRSSEGASWIGTAYIVTQSHFQCALRSLHTQLWDSLRRAAVTHSYFKYALRSAYTKLWDTACCSVMMLVQNRLLDVLYVVKYSFWIRAANTVMAKNIGTLGKHDQRRLWKFICIVNPFELLFKKNYKNLTFHWRIRILNGGKYHYEINVQPSLLVWTLSESLT